MAERKSIADRIAEHNALQPEPDAPPVGQKVRAKIDGRFLGPDLRAVKAKAGDIVEVRRGEYAQSLLDDGLAEPIKSQSRRKRSK